MSVIAVSAAMRIHSRRVWIRGLSESADSSAVVSCGVGGTGSGVALSVDEAFGTSLPFRQAALEREKPLRTTLDE